jgi:hypothetical protein
MDDVVPQVADSLPAKSVAPQSHSALTIKGHPRCALPLRCDDHYAPVLDLHPCKVGTASERPDPFHPLACLRTEVRSVLKAIRR